MAISRFFRWLRHKFLRRQRAPFLRQGLPRPLTVEALEERVLMNGDLAELNAANWHAVAADHASISVVDDTSLVRAGAGSLRLSTQSGADVSLAYPASGSAAWDLSTPQALHV